MDGEEEDGDDFIYQDEVLAVVSSDDENDQQGIEEDMDDLQLEEEEEQSFDESDEEMTVNMFSPLKDDSVCKLSAHKGPVFTISIDHTSSMVCTGGQDDRGLVWKLSDGQIVFECTGHKESVTCCGFSHDGKYLCTSDLSGLIQVWQMTSDVGKMIWNFEVSSIEWILWHSQAHILICGTSDGEAWLWRIPSGDCKTLPSSGYGNMAGILLPNGKQLCCGYFDGSVKVWDIKNASQVSSLSNQDSPVTCLACHANGNTVLVGYMSGLSLLVSVNEAKVLANFSSQGSSKDDPETNDNRSVESVAFAPVDSGHQLAFVAMITGHMTAWDLPTQKIRYSIQTGSGIVKLIVSSMNPVIYTCHLDGIVRKWEMVTGACLNKWHGHSAGILDMVLSRDESKLLTSSDDMCTFVYSTTNSSQSNDDDSFNHQTIEK